MALRDFNFQPFDAGRLKHIERHFNSQRAGSYFCRSFFKSSRDAAEFAFFYLDRNLEYRGEKLTVIISTPVSIGYNGIVCLDELPENAEIIKRRGIRSNYELKIVRGIEKKTTNRLIVIAGPLRRKNNENPEIHGFYTIFPGEYSPTLPKKTENLMIRYSGLELEKALEENRKNFEFWEKHALIECPI